MQPIVRIDENPYLRKEYESLTLFYKSNEILGHFSPSDLDERFFAYHGSSVDAIEAICQTGFDPKRHFGQVHGSGEYFGVTALISPIYSQKGGSQGGFTHMTIAFVLRCTEVKTVDNSRYVVDNPTDWAHAFYLPVLIVTYGRNAASQPYPFPAEIRYHYDIKYFWTEPFRWYWQQHNG